MKLRKVESSGNQRHQLLARVVDALWRGRDDLRGICQTCVNFKGRQRYGYVPRRRSVSDGYANETLLGLHPSHLNENCLWISRGPGSPAYLSRLQKLHQRAVGCRGIRTTATITDRWTKATAPAPHSYVSCNRRVWMIGVHIEHLASQ